jgi:hypothetical protein
VLGLDEVTLPSNPLDSTAEQQQDYGASQGVHNRTTLDGSSILQGAGPRLRYRDSAYVWEGSDIVQPKARLATATKTLIQE